MRRVSCLFVCVCAISCSRNEYGDHPPHPVSGSLLVNGAPAGNADVMLFHLGNWGEKTIIPMARTAEDGTFELATYGELDGAPDGDYQIEVVWPAYRHGRNIGPDKLGGKYAKRLTSGLKVTIDSNTHKMPPLELTVDPAKLKTDSPPKNLSEQEKLNIKRKKR